MLLKPLGYEPARHLYRLATNRDYRDWCLLDAALGNAPRFVERRVRVHGWSLLVPDPASLLSAYREIFVNRIYAFDATTPEPRVLDIGANVGVSALFLKTLYPKAKITAYEADPEIFRYLERNVHGNGFTDVELVNKAVWERTGSLTFQADHADGGRVTSAGEPATIGVDAVDIRDVMAGEQFDFVKIDIEGGEMTVLRRCAPELLRVRNIFVEYHSVAGQRQELADLIDILTRAGFRVDIHNLAPNPHPLVCGPVRSRFDLLLNVFGRRD